MELTKLSKFGDLKNKIKFVNISDKEQSLFDWKSSGSFSNYSLELNNIRKNEINNYYFTIDKGENKIVYVKKKDLFFTIGAEKSVQKQLIEAILDAIESKFNEVYDFEIILSYGNFDQSIFKNFKDDLYKVFENFEELKLVKQVRISCTVCIEMFTIIVKRTLIENAPNYPVPIVCTHVDHDLLVYIDKDYNVRGMSPISFA